MLAVLLFLHRAFVVFLYLGRAAPLDAPARRRGAYVPVSHAIPAIRKTLDAWYVLVVLLLHAHWPLAHDECILAIWEKRRLDAAYPAGRCPGIGQANDRLPRVVRDNMLYAMPPLLFCVTLRNPQWNAGVRAAQGF